jgi:hypothetical protein
VNWDIGSVEARAIASDYGLSRYGHPCPPIRAELQSCCDLCIDGRNTCWPPRPTNRCLRFSLTHEPLASIFFLRLPFPRKWDEEDLEQVLYVVGVFVPLGSGVELTPPFKDALILRYSASLMSPPLRISSKFFSSESTNSVSSEDEPRNFDST